MAKQVVQYCIINLPDSGIISVDFRQSPEPAWKDFRGACIIARGLLEIAGYISETEREMCIQAVMKILKAFAENRADWSENCDAIFQNCSDAYNDKEHHITIFMEALYKLVEKGILFWQKFIDV